MPSVGKNSVAKGDNSVSSDGIFTWIRARATLGFLMVGEVMLKSWWWPCMMENGIESWWWPCMMENGVESEVNGGRRG